MGKFLNSFLEFKNEADATRKFALFAVVIITLGLASLSVTGIVATADWSVLSFMPIMGMIIAVLGAELLATVAFIRTLTASTKLRKVAGAFIFLGLAAVGVHNAENGAKVVWPDRFAESSGSLAAKGSLSQTRADTIASVTTTAVANIPLELERVRSEIAKLEVFTKQMSAQTPEGIKAAQSEMIPRCGYTGAVDGIRSSLTESAMRSCGEQIRGELANLKQRETNLLGGQPLAAPVTPPGVDAPVDPALAAIEFNDKASAAFWAWLWLIIMLCTLEGARSLSLWALITDISSTDAKRDREWTDELAALRHQQERAKIIAETNAAVAAYSPPPAPVEAAPAPPPEPDPLTLDEPVPPVEEAYPSWRPGLMAANHAKAAKKAQVGKYILVPSLVARDAEMQAAKLAAE